MFLHAHTTMTYLHCGPFISQCSTSICQSSVIPTYMYIKHAITLKEYQISYELPTIPRKFLTIWYQERHQLFSCKEWKEWWMRFVETWESIQASILLVRTLTVSVLTHCGVYGGIPGVYSHFSHSTPSKTPSLAYTCTLQSNVRYNNRQCIIICKLFLTKTTGTKHQIPHASMYLFMKEVKEVLLPFFRRYSGKFEFLHVCLQKFI